jgi:hypothetical protein
MMLRLVLDEKRKDKIRKAAMDEATRVTGSALLPSTKLAVDAAVEAAISKIEELLA